MKAIALESTIWSDSACIWHKLRFLKGLCLMEIMNVMSRVLLGNEYPALSLGLQIYFLASPAP